MNATENQNGVFKIVRDLNERPHNIVQRVRQSQISKHMKNIEQ